MTTKVRVFIASVNELLKYFTIGGTDGIWRYNLYD